MDASLPAGTLRHERIVPAPPEAVRQAFADPARLARWWGPAGFRNEIHEFDLRPGGRWLLTMVAPGGERYTMEKRFTAVEPRRIVVEHVQAGHSFTLEMSFDPAPGGTRVAWTTRFATPEQLEAVREAFTQGNVDNLERLCQEVASGQGA